MPKAQVHNLRQQTIYANANEPLYICLKMEDGTKRYLNVERVWIDTQMAPVGSGLYLAADINDIVLK